MLYRRTNLIPHDPPGDPTWWRDNTLIPFTDMASRAILARGPLPVQLTKYDELHSCRVVGS
jgi:hypothetical protein